MKKKFLKIIILILLLILIVFVGLYVVDHKKMEKGEEVIFSTWGKKYAPNGKNIKSSENNNNNKNNNNNDDNNKNVNPSTNTLTAVLSLEDSLLDNSVWCGTFNLIWNDLKNDLAKQDIVFNPQLDVVKNLNKGTFSVADISEDAYYKIYGEPTLELKKEIERAIKEKFNETSDILDNFDWTDDKNSDFLYVMLKKEFEFNKEFTELEDSKFGDYENVKFFGINEDTDEVVRNQVKVLYYNSKNDFAIKLLTKSNDEVIITKGTKSNTFGDIYEEIMKNSESYDGNKKFSNNDILKIPNIEIDIKEEFEELENQIFYFSNGEEHIIGKALQTIKFELNKKGGKIKSEAGMMIQDTAIIIEENERREFLVDDTFTIFLKEDEKELPYFAAKITNINTIQNINK